MSEKPCHPFARDWCKFLVFCEQFGHGDLPHLQSAQFASQVRSSQIAEHVQEKEKKAEEARQQQERQKKEEAARKEAEDRAKAAEAAKRAQKEEEAAKVKAQRDKEMEEIQVSKCITSRNAQLLPEF